MPRRRRNGTISKRLKRVSTGKTPDGPKKISSKRRAREARERLRRASNDGNSSSNSSSSDEDVDEMNERDAMRICRDTDSFEVIGQFLGHSSPRVRVSALEAICPCRVWGNKDEQIWSKVCSMTKDNDLGVRKQVLHTLCDGSPALFEHDIIDAIESFNSERDRNLRRMAHKVMAHYRRTGKWNIM